MLPLFKVFMSPDVLTPLNETLMSGFITQGPKVEQFEGALKAFFKHDHILTLNSATSGLTLALRLLHTPDPENGWPGIQDGDEVLTPALTCFATTVPVMANGLKIKWLDVDKNTCNIDLDDLKAKLSPTTKVIQFVHWGGMPVDLDKIRQLQDYALETFGFRPQVIEDCAHAFGAVYKDRLLGTHGNICVFSLQAIKHLTTGDGGLLFLPTKQLYSRAKLLRWYGIDREARSGGGDFRMEPDIPEWGYKYHMNDINAVLGLYNLPHISGLLDKNRYNASFYKSNIKNPKVSLLTDEPYSQSAYWLFSFRITDKPDFIKYMKEKNIMVSQVHNRNDNHSTVAAFKTPLPQLDQMEKELVCIPVGWWLTQENLEYIVKCVNEF